MLLVAFKEHLCVVFCLLGFFFLFPLLFALLDYFFSLLHLVLQRGLANTRAIKARAGKERFSCFLSQLQYPGLRLCLQGAECGGRGGEGWAPCQRVTLLGFSATSEN